MTGTAGDLRHDSANGARRSAPDAASAEIVRLADHRRPLEGRAETASTEPAKVLMFTGVQIVRDEASPEVPGRAKP